MNPLPSWMLAAGAAAQGQFDQAGFALTLGGEPTYVPLNPQGLE